MRRRLRFPIHAPVVRGCFTGQRPAVLRFAGVVHNIVDDCPGVVPIVCLSHATPHAGRSPLQSSLIAWLDGAGIEPASANRSPRRTLQPPRVSSRPCATSIQSSPLPLDRCLTPGATPQWAACSVSHGTLAGGIERQVITLRRGAAGYGLGRAVAPNTSAAATAQASPNERSPEGGARRLPVGRGRAARLATVAGVAPQR